MVNGAAFRRLWSDRSHLLRSFCYGWCFSCRGGGVQALDPHCTWPSLALTINNKYMISGVYSISLSNHIFYFKIYHSTQLLFKQLLIISIALELRLMLRKIHTTQNHRKFYHEKEPVESKSNNITRPPTSHPYSRLKNMRSHETLHPQLSHCQRTPFQKEEENDYQNLISPFWDDKNTSKKLPKSFMHLLTQLKILFKTKDKYDEKYLNKIILSLCAKVSDLSKENQEQKSLLAQKQQNLVRQDGTIEQLSKQIKRLQSSNFHNSKQTNKSLSKNNSNELLLQNIKLAQLNQVYLNRINGLTEDKKEKHIEITKELECNENTEVLRYHNRITYLQMKMKNSEDKEVEISQKLSSLEEENQMYALKILQFEREKESIEDKLSQWRQRAHMQLQDSEMHLTRQNFLLFSIKKLRELNKSLTEKLIHQGNSDGNGYKAQIEPNPYFQYEIDFFKNIKSVFFDGKYKQFKLNINKKNESLEMTTLQIEEEYLEYRRFQEINLTLFSYYMPSFFSFIEQSLTSQISTTRNKGNGSVSRIFIQILRAILNSKLNEFLMLSQQRFTKFPEFLYTWFQRFYFNSDKSDIAALQPYMQKPFPQDLFYRDLMNIKLDQSWEIITFRQFLLEELNLQELYFYLMCQNLLFRRGSISKQNQYQGDFCILVEYNAAKSVLDMVLSDFESWNLSYLTSKLREKVIYKKNVEYIQSGFFLRCLIEYYKIQRINRYKYIKKLCDQFKSEEKGLRFSSFISVINRFTEVSIEQKIKLYRESYCLGKGKITAETIFTVCSENLVFLKYLKLKCFFKLPMMTTLKSMRNMQMALSKKNNQIQPQKKTIICLQPSDPYLYSIYLKMISLLKADKLFTQQFQRLGLIDLLNQLSKIQKIFDDKLSNTDNSVLRCKHFMHYLNEVLGNIRIVNFSHFYELLEEENKRKNNHSFWIDIDESQLSQLMAGEFKATLAIHHQLTNYVSWKNRVYEFRLNHAARKIQRMARKKFITPFIQLYKIIYSEFKQGEIPKK